MDLLSTIHKSGSRGGVNFSWDDVQTSSHRENYLGHSIKAPVGRWAKGRDLDWYAKGDDKTGDGNETSEERKFRERKEEMRRIKEAEEDAMDKALGRPVRDRGLTGANAITVGEVNRAVKEADIGQEGEEDRAVGFGDFVGKIGEENVEEGEAANKEKGGLLGRAGDEERTARKNDHRGKHRGDRRDRNGSRDRGDRAHREERVHREKRRDEGARNHSRDRGGRADNRGATRHRYRERSRERDRSRSPGDEPSWVRREKERAQRRRDGSGEERSSRRYRERTPDRHNRRRENGYEERRRHSRRSASPDRRGRSPRR